MVPLLGHLLGVAGQVLLAVVGQAVVRLPHDDRRVVAGGHHQVAVILALVGQCRLVLERPLVVATVDDEHHSQRVASRKSLGIGRLMTHAQHVAATLDDAAHVGPLQGRWHGGSQSGIDVAVAEAPQHAPLVVDVAVVLVPGDGAQAHRLTMLVGLLAVGPHLVDHGVEVWLARHAHGIP